MKKTLAIILTSVMVLSCSMTAFAEVKVNGNAQTPDVAGKVIYTDDDAAYVSVNASADDLTVENGVKNGEAAYNAVDASGGGHVTVGKGIEDTSDKSAIVASGKETEVKVAENVTETEVGDAVAAMSGATVVIDGSVKEEGDGSAINLQVQGADPDTEVIVGQDVWEEGNGSAVEIAAGTVTIKGQIQECDDGDAIWASGSTSKVTVDGYVKEDLGGIGVRAEDGAAVYISGGVFSTDMGADDYAIKVETGATVMVGGRVRSGDVYLGDGTVLIELSLADNIEVGSDGGRAYIGQLGDQSEIKGVGIDDAKAKDTVHYLIGTIDGQNNKFTVTGTIIAANTQDGVKNKGYYYTTTADAEKLTGQSFVIKSTDSSKGIKIDATYAGVNVVNNPDGTVTLTLGSDFRGGIQELELIFEDIARKINSSSGSTYTLYTGTWNKPVTNGKWTQNADGTWSYTTSRKFTSTWGCIANPNDAASAAWYYFDGNGIMLTGWQKLYWNGAYRWYYFSQTKDANEGKCQLGGITPDGYIVDESGAWIEN